MLYDYDGSGKERELVMSAYTLMVYEQEFKTGMIEDVFGKVRLSDEDDSEVVLDFTRDNWFAYIKALWAMLKAGMDLARAERRQYEYVPSFNEWSLKATSFDIQEVSRVVIEACQAGLFRASAAATPGDGKPEGEE